MTSTECETFKHEVGLANEKQDMDSLTPELFLHPEGCEDCEKWLEGVFQKEVSAFGRELLEGIRIALAEAESAASDEIE